MKQSFDSNVKINYCGEIIGYEFAFTDVEHLLNTIKSKGRLLPCPKCKKVILNLLS